MQYDKDNFDLSESGNWNFAQNYSTFLYSITQQISDYYDLAYYGTSTILEDFLIDEPTKIQARLRAVRRLNRTMIKLVRFSRSFVKDYRQKKMEEIRIQLAEFSSIIPKLELRKQKRDSIEIAIDEENFLKFMQFHEELLERILEYMNEAELIFSSSNDIDPTKWKSMIKDRLTSHG